MARTHYLNADFDLALRTAEPRRPGALARQVDELSLQALLGTAPGDAVIVRSPVPDAYLDHLADCGLEVPRILTHPSTDPETTLRPFGWNAETIEINARHLSPAPHPEPDVIRRVNGRSFALELERELTPDAPHGTIVRDVDAFEAALGGGMTSTGGMVKAEHGNAGLGNRRIRHAAPSPDDRAFAERRLAEDGRLLVEPWLERVRDWSAIFDVPFDEAGFRVHETRCTADGAIVGALFEPDVTQPVHGPLAETARAVAARLERAGYHGPVCLDAIEWNDAGRVRLRPIVDLNARRALSDGAYRAWRSICPDRTVLYRTVARRRLALPATQDELLEALGEARYRSDRRRGVLLAAPDSATARVAFLVIGRDRDDVAALERTIA